jgi:hypothetical protein
MSLALCKEWIDGGEQKEADLVIIRTVQGDHESSSGVEEEEMA